MHPLLALPPQKAINSILDSRILLNTKLMYFLTNIQTADYESAII